MVRNDRDSRTERQRLTNTIADLRKQLELADAMQRQIRKPAPTLIQQKSGEYLRGRVVSRLALALTY